MCRDAYGVQRLQQIERFYVLLFAREHWTAHNNAVRRKSANVMAHAGTAGDQRARPSCLEPHRFLEISVEGFSSIDAIRSVSGIRAASTLNQVLAKFSVPEFAADMRRTSADMS